MNIVTLQSELPVYFKEDFLLLLRGVDGLLLQS